MKPKAKRVPGSNPGDKVPARQWSQFRLRPDLEEEITAFSEHLFISRTDAISLLLGFAFRQIQDGANPFAGDTSPLTPKTPPSGSRKGGKEAI
jgi:hypothetical protein